MGDGLAGILQVRVDTHVRKSAGHIDRVLHKSEKKRRVGMMKRRNNTVDIEQAVVVETEEIIALSDTKVLFLRDVRGLAKKTQRWHKENLNALEKALGLQVSLHLV